MCIYSGNVLVSLMLAWLVTFLSPKTKKPIKFNQPSAIDRLEEKQKHRLPRSESVLRSPGSPSNNSTTEPSYRRGCYASVCSWFPGRTGMDGRESCKRICVGFRGFNWYSMISYYSMPLLY